jgi:hypothetical protein
MSNQTRVLNRQGARELTPEELERVPAGLGTKTKCTFAPERSGRDGDVSVSSRDGDASIGEC